jgi:hypothetical protein
MNSFYDLIHSHLDDVWEIPCQWPANILLYSEMNAAYTQIRFNVEDRERLFEFKRTLEAHMATVSCARNLIREFIKDKFSAEEILYVSKDMPSRENL